MNLHILNDLHIEFEDFVPPVADADVVILAGDIGVGMEGLRWAEARFPDRPVIYVPGEPRVLSPRHRPDRRAEGAGTGAHPRSER
jgi:hypothetical protein